MKIAADSYFYTHPDDITGQTFLLRDDEFSHATKSLRLTEGELIHATNGEGKLFTAELCAINKSDKTVECSIIKQQLKPNEPMSEVILLQAVVKGDRFEYFVEKAVEIGASAIVPIITERTQVTPGAGKITRWNRIALAAMKQSKRSILPEIHAPLAFRDAIEKFSRSAIVLLLSGNGKTSMADVLRRQSGGGKYVIAVGPEGDFTKEEIKLSISAGFKETTLGTRRLRSETAGIVALSTILTNELS